MSFAREVQTGLLHFGLVNPIECGLVLIRSVVFFFFLGNKSVVLFCLLLGETMGGGLAEEVMQWEIKGMLKKMNQILLVKQV